MKATSSNGRLEPIQDCYIRVPTPVNLELDYGMIIMHTLPDISDSKGASYADETAIGRSFPFKNYSYSENRVINWTIHFVVCSNIGSFSNYTDVDTIIKQIRILKSCVYPGDGANNAPYTPPAICQIKCGKLLDDDPLCVVLKNYSLKFPTDVAWHEDGYIPSKIDMDLTFEVVYTSEDLPGSQKIMGNLFLPRL